ncbi:MAG: hypothetical protein ACMUIP_00020 [bacterium]
MANISGILSTHRVDKISSKHQDKRFPREQKKRNKENKKNKEKEVEEELLHGTRSETDHVIDINI